MKTRAALEGIRGYDLGGLELGYSTSDHTGLDFADLSIINKDGKFTLADVASELARPRSNAHRRHLPSPASLVFLHRITASATPPVQPRCNWYRLRLIALIALAVVGLLLGQPAVTVPHLLNRWRQPGSRTRLAVMRCTLARHRSTCLPCISSPVRCRSRTAAQRWQASMSFELRGAWVAVQLAWTVDKLSLIKPEINARIGGNGSIDWQRFVDAFPKSDGPPSSTVPRVPLRNVTVDGGSVRLIDEAEAAGRDASDA